MLHSAGKNRTSFQHVWKKLSSVPRDQNNQKDRPQDLENHFPQSKTTKNQENFSKFLSQNLIFQSRVVPKKPKVTLYACETVCFGKNLWWHFGFKNFGKNSHNAENSEKGTLWSHL